MRMVPANAAPKPNDDVCWASTHSSHAADAYIGKAKTCFNVSIHAPGLGSARRSQGAKDNSRYGRGSPHPSGTKMHSPPSAECVRPAPTAAAMNGAVHGVATRVVSTPVKNEAR